MIRPYNVVCLKQVIKCLQWCRRAWVGRRHCQALKTCQGPIPVRNDDGLCCVGAPDKDDDQIWQKGSNLRQRTPLCVGLCSSRISVFSNDRRLLFVTPWSIYMNQPRRRTNTTLLYTLGSSLLLPFLWSTFTHLLSRISSTTQFSPILQFHSTPTARPLFLIFTVQLLFLMSPLGRPLPWIKYLYRWQCILKALVSAPWTKDSKCFQRYCLQFCTSSSCLRISVPYINGTYSYICTFQGWWNFVDILIVQSYSINWDWSKSTFVLVLVLVLVHKEYHPETKGVSRKITRMPHISTYLVLL
jgi:hypothetical protein